MRSFIISAILFLSIPLCAQDTYILMVSFDGFRYDYADKYDLPHFRQLAREGASAKFMRPSYPSKTFPNHYTLVTGLYPGHHGLVDNTFYDPEREIFYGTNNRERVEDPYFYGGLPIWQLVQENGMKSASYFWVGSEAPINGRYPDIFKYYDHDFPDDQRIDSVFQWFDLPKARRPNITTLYFSLVDSQSHTTGPNSDETYQTLLEADRLLGRIMEGISNSDLPIQLIVVSDHGMYEMHYDVNTYIDIGDLISFPNNTVKLANNETHIHIYANDSADIEWIYETLKARESNYHTYLRQEIPAEWQYRESPRVGDILLVAEAGHAFKVASKNDTYGSHGFNPYSVQEMGAIFYAWGSRIKPGIRLEPFQNVHVYPFIARLLGIEAPGCDGDVTVLEGIIRD